MTEEIKPVENPKLVMAIQAMFDNNNAEMQSRMIDEVMRATFISPVVINSENQEPDEDGKTGIDFHMLENTDKQKFFMAFTDLDEMEKWKKKEEQQTAILSFDEYASMVLDKESVSEGFVINPFGENLIFNKRLITSLFQQKQAMNKGAKADTTGNEKQILVGKPDIYPQEMVDAITQYLKTDSKVEAAYLRFMVKDNIPSYLVIVDCKGDLNDSVKGIANSANDYLNGLQINLFSIDSELGKNASENVEPFYKK